MEILREYTTEHKVWRDGGYVYKRQTPYLTENELWCYKTLSDTDFVTYCERVDAYTIRMQYIGKSMPVTNKELFLGHLPAILLALKKAGIRHGDLTEYALIVRHNFPRLIDFAESRLWDDPRTDKRPEGDKFWLTKTMHKLVAHL